MADGSYPVADREDAANAVQAVGRGGADHDAIRRHIAERLHALHLSDLMPPDWQPDGSLRTNPEDVCYRAIPSASLEGRTLVGVAIPWERPALVAEHFAPNRPYLEDFDRHSADLTLRMHPESRPLFSFHGHVRGENPIGTVAYRVAASALMFEAPLLRTPAADEALELVKGGAMDDVSAGFRPLKSTRYRSADGTVTRRMEIALKELSVAPTGFGQVPGAKTLAIRAAVPVAPAVDLEKLRRDNLLRLRSGRPLLPIPPATAPAADEATPPPGAGTDEDSTYPYTKGIQ